MRWDTQDTWNRLADQALPWYEMENGAYVYKNVADGQWWIDEPNGSGVYVALSDAPLPPASGWRALGAEATGGGARPGQPSPLGLPQVEIVA